MANGKTTQASAPAIPPLFNPPVPSPTQMPQLNQLLTAAMAVNLFPALGAIPVALGAFERGRIVGEQERLNREQQLLQIQNMQLQQAEQLWRFQNILPIEAERQRLQLAQEQFNFEWEKRERPIKFAILQWNEKLAETQAKQAELNYQLMSKTFDEQVNALKSQYRAQAAESEFVAENINRDRQAVQQIAALAKENTELLKQLHEIEAELARTPMTSPRYGQLIQQRAELRRRLQTNTDSMRQHLTVITNPQLFQSAAQGVQFYERAWETLSDNNMMMDLVMNAIWGNSEYRQVYQQYFDEALLSMGDPSQLTPEQYQQAVNAATNRFLVWLMRRSPDEMGLMLHNYFLNQMMRDRQLNTGDFQTMVYGTTNFLKIAAQLRMHRERMEHLDNVLRETIRHNKAMEGISRERIGVQWAIERLRDARQWGIARMRLRLQERHLSLQEREALQRDARASFANFLKLLGLAQSLLTATGKTNLPIEARQALGMIYNELARRLDPKTLDKIMGVARTITSGRPVDERTLDAAMDALDKVIPPGMLSRLAGDAENAIYDLLTPTEPTTGISGLPELGTLTYPMGASGRGGITTLPSPFPAAPQQQPQQPSVVVVPVPHGGARGQTVIMGPPSALAGGMPAGGMQPVTLPPSTVTGAQDWGIPVAGAGAGAGRAAAPTPAPAPAPTPVPTPGAASLGITPRGLLTTTMRDFFAKLLPSDWLGRLRAALSGRSSLYELYYLTPTERHSRELVRSLAQDFVKQHGQVTPDVLQHNVEEAVATMGDIYGKALSSAAYELERHNRTMSTLQRARSILQRDRTNKSILTMAAQSLADLLRVAVSAYVDNLPVTGNVQWEFQWHYGAPDAARKLGNAYLVARIFANPQTGSVHIVVENRYEQGYGTRKWKTETVLNTTARIPVKRRTTSRSQSKSQAQSQAQSQAPAKAGAKAGATSGR